MAGDFKLKGEDVFVKFIKVQRGIVTDPKHVAYGGMIEGAKRVIPAKKLRNGQYANVLNDNEKQVLEGILGRDLSIYNKKDNYWDEISIPLTKETSYFDTRNPEDYIKVKVLESYDDLIAPSLKNYNEQRKKTYQFILIRGEEESKIKNAEGDIKQQAWMKLGKIEENQEAMVDALLMMQIKVAPGSSKDWVRARIIEEIEANPRKFVATLNDPDYLIKVLIKKAIVAKLIVSNGGLYQTTEGVNICHANLQPTLVNALDYLKSPDGQDLRMMLEAKIQQ